MLAMVSAQNSKYWVFLKNKKSVTFDPYSYFDKKAIERRIANGISLVDSTDFPLNSIYETSITSLADSVSHSSRWFNAMCVYASSEKIEEIRNLPFVSDVELMESAPIACSVEGAGWDTTLNASMTSILEKQTKRMGGDLFENAGIDGKGIRIAIFDGGFPSVNTSPVFEQIRKENRIIKTWDFAKNKEFVYGYMSHGTMTMSCIAGMIKGKKIGLATGAEFLLARTEVKREIFSEEENWLAAVEWADKNGADIISSSLGYTYQRYFQNQMDGKTTLVTRAANFAARKGMLVVNAAGNDGDNDWHIVGAPADADSCLSVGGIDPITDFHITFSSLGPTWDKRAKPNISTFGHVAAAGKNGMQQVDGTSFACPLAAGFAACAWQMNRSLKNMQMFLEIEKSADLYPYFDYAHGFGVPQASYFTENKKQISDTSFDFVKKEDVLKVMVRQAYLDKKTGGFQSHLYYNIQDTDGLLTEYNVILVSSNEVLSFRTSNYKKGEKLNVHLGSYTGSYTF